jgi:outer membrane protein OmpA-like peptidoglycan-associated protein
LGYGLGLYQGLQLILPVETALSNWAPVVPSTSPEAVLTTAAQAPQAILLDSLSLFSPGKAELKPDATKVLVTALVEIKAKLNGFVVISGHTDNTGTLERNQVLSQQRAEAVRNWMRDTGDIPEHCFAVQGYGASRPVATNDTAAGRALNRRVEISVVPQAKACL